MNDNINAFEFIERIQDHISIYNCFYDLNDEEEIF